MGRTRLIAGIVWSTLLAAPLSAQPGELPLEVVESIAISGDQMRDIRGYVASGLQLLESDDRARMRRGRQALLVPLQNPRASVTFRLAFSEEAAPSLRRSAQGPSEVRAINALIVAGALGTTQGTRVLDRSITDARIAVRYSAIRGYRRTLLVVNEAPAMPPDDAQAVVATLGAHLAREKDPDAFDACVRSLIQAAGITRTGFQDVRLKAVRSLARACDERIRSLPADPSADPFLKAIVRAGKSLRDAAADQQLGLDQGASRLILEFGADLRVYLVRRIEAGQLPHIGPNDSVDTTAQARATRALAGQAAQIGHATMFFAGVRLGTGKPFDPKGSAAWILAATPEGDARFVRRARELIGPTGVPTQPPFNYPPNRFLR